MIHTKITESAIEQFAIDLLGKAGYQHIYGPDIAPDSVTPERPSFEDALLMVLPDSDGLLPLAHLLKNPLFDKARTLYWKRFLRIL